jgi:hypothetical protein
MKAARESAHQTDRTICRAQKQRASIRGDRTTIERRNHFASFNGLRHNNFR